MKTAILSLAALALITTGVQAQDSKSKSPKAKTSFGVKAAVTASNITGKDGSGKKLDNKTAIRFNLGFNAEFPVAQDFYFQPGVSLDTKGYVSKNTTPEQKLNLFYIDVPMNFIYKPASGNGHVLVGFGPYVGFGIGGKLKIMSSPEQNIDVEYRNSVNATTPAGRVYLKRVDAGANVLFGYEWNSGLSLQLNSQIGLTNLVPDMTTIFKRKKPITLLMVLVLAIASENKT